RSRAYTDTGILIQSQERHNINGGAYRSSYGFPERFKLDLSTYPPIAYLILAADRCGRDGWTKRLTG
ncbi:MAG: hypothetical protein ABJA60_10710, partial [Nitrosospira sp.]